MIHVHRIYDHEPIPDGERYLVDRLWPRGVAKDKLGLTAWLREAAPSTELRLWFRHDPTKWTEFQRRYFAELDGNPEAWRMLVDGVRRGPVVLLYGSKFKEINNAIALQTYIEAKVSTGNRHRKPR
jgi:uncharacterized protein YeaO (DUF488 family)